MYGSMETDDKKLALQISNNIFGFAKNIINQQQFYP